MAKDFWLKPEHASPLPLKRRGLRRPKAHFLSSTAKGERYGKSHVWPVSLPGWLYRR